MCRSPAKEPRQPEKEKKGRGTGIGTFMPTCVKEHTEIIFRVGPNRAYKKKAVKYHI
jgi:hypothetical protein